MQKSIVAIRWIFAWPLLGLALASTGCMQSELGDPNPYYSVTQEKDIPAPRDFLFDKDRSYTYTLYRDPKGIGTFRNSTLYYYGDQHVGKLVPWYQEQMKADGWSYRESKDDQDRRCLIFTKTNETATIQIYREFDSRKDRYLTFVQAEIHPTRTEEMASDELLNSPLLPQGTEGSSGAEGSPDGVSPADDEISPRPASAEESSIIMNPARGEKSARISGAAAPRKPTSPAPAQAVAAKAGPSRAVTTPKPAAPRLAPPATAKSDIEGDNQVVNEEMGAAGVKDGDGEESAGEAPTVSSPEDEDSEK